MCGRACVRVLGQVMSECLMYTSLSGDKKGHVFTGLPQWLSGYKNPAAVQQTQEMQV